MATQNQDDRIAIAAGQADTEQFRLVKADGTYQDGASTARTHIGVTQERQSTSGDPVTVRTKPGDCKLTAEEAISAGDPIYYGDDGKVGLTDTDNTQVGIALTDADDDGAIFEAVLF